MTTAEKIVNLNQSKIIKLHVIDTKSNPIFVSFLICASNYFVKENQICCQFPPHNHDAYIYFEEICLHQPLISLDTFTLSLSLTFKICKTFTNPFIVWFPMMVKMEK